MKRKHVIVLFVMLALLSACRNPADTTNTTNNTKPEEQPDKAAGAAVSVPVQASVTQTQITINAVTLSSNPGNQTAEYAIATAASPAPTSGWQDGLIFNGLTPDTDYFVFARSKENENYKAGAAQVSAAIRTLSAVTEVPAAKGAVLSGIYRNMFKEWGKTDAEVTAKVTNAWNKLFVSGTTDEKIFVETGSDMAYIYTADTNDVRSEGMSYGMMMCVQMDDKTRFDKLWKWAKTYMYNETTNAGNNNRGYFAWQCNTNGTRKDQSPAPDGEFYFVTSLLFASARWGNGTGDFDYGKYARKILYDMVHRTPNNTVDPYGAPTMFNLTYKMPVFVPYGSAANYTDPSYHLPAFYEIWADELENDYDDGQLSGIWSSLNELKTDFEFYRAAAQASRAFFPTTTNSTTGLGPDYANFDGTPTGGDHADFKFDAWRIAMNIGVDYAWWEKDPWQQTFADRIQAFFISKGITTYKNQWKLDGSSSTGDHSPGLVGCNAVASLAAANTENAKKFLEDFWNINMTTGTYRYYDGCLYMMCMLHLSGNFKAYLTNTTPSASISPAAAAFDKKAGEQADIQVTITPNGNSLSNIKNGATLLASGTDYTVSGNTVTIKASYLAAQPNGTTTLTFTFSAGKARNIAITVTDTTGGGVSKLKYDFAVDTTVVPTYSSSNISATNSGGVLSLSKTGSYSADYFLLPFTLPAGKNLSNYSKINILYKGTAGDGSGSGKQFGAVVNPSGSTYTKFTATLSTLPNTQSVITLTRDTSVNVSTYTGTFNIGFGNLNANSGTKYEIASIELVE